MLPKNCGIEFRVVATIARVSVPIDRSIGGNVERWIAILIVVFAVIILDWGWIARSIRKAEAPAENKHRCNRRTPYATRCLHSKSSCVGRKSPSSNFGSPRTSNHLDRRQLHCEIIEIVEPKFTAVMAAAIVPNQRGGVERCVFSVRVH